MTRAVVPGSDDPGKPPVVVRPGPEGSTKIRGYPGPGGLHPPEQAVIWRGLTVPARRAGQFTGFGARGPRTPPGVRGPLRGSGVLLVRTLLCLGRARLHSGLLRLGLL